VRVQGGEYFRFSFRLALAKTLLLVAGAGMLWSAFLRHDVLYPPVTAETLGFFAQAVFGAWLFHRGLHVGVLDEDRAGVGNL